MTWSQALGRDLARFLVSGAIALVTLAVTGMPVPNVLEFLFLYTLLSFLAGAVLMIGGVLILAALKVRLW